MTPCATRRAGRTLPRPLLAVVLACVVPLCAWSQSPVRLVPNAGEFVLDLDSYRLGIADSLGWQRTNVRNSLRIPFAGTVVHENLAKYTLDLRPTLRRLWSGSNAGTQSLATRELGYDGRAQLFAITRFPLAMQTIKLSGATQGDFGEHQDYDEKFSGAEVSWRNTMLPLSASVSHRAFRDTWYPAFQQRPLLRNERTDVARWSARNSKTSASAERTNFSDPTTGSRLRTSAESFSNLFRWGRGSYLTSTGNRNEIAGTMGYTRSNWSQRARIQHKKHVYSNTSYLFYALGSERFSNRGHAETMNLLVQAAPSLLFGMRASQTFANFGSGQARMISVGPNIAFERSLGRRVAFMGTAGIYRDWHQRDLRDRTVFVVDEPHMIDSSRRIMLRRPSIEVATLDVRSADRTTRFTVGVDYQLFVTEVTSELVAIPGGRIAVGDTLLLTYAFLLPARQPVNGISADYATTLTAGPFSIFHRRSRLGAQSPTSVEFLGASTDERSTGARLSWQRELGSLDLSAEERRRVSGGLTYLAREGRASVAARTRAGTQALLSVSVNRAEVGQFRTDAASLTGGMSWWASRALRLNMELRGWSWRPTGASSEELLGGAFGGELHLGLTDLAVRYEAYARQFGGVPGRESRVVTRLVRKY